VDEAEDPPPEAEEDLLQLLGAGGEPPVLFRLREGTLDPIPLLIRSSSSNTA